MLLYEMTREAVRAVAGEAVAVVPTAAIEQHGPHLPVGTDSCIAAAVAERSAQRAEAEAPIVVTPVVSYGISAHHFPFPGVMSLSMEHFIGTLRDLGDSLARSGFRRVYILNAHGGNDEAVRLAARWIGQERGVICGAASYWTLAWEPLSELGQSLGISSLPGHAGAFETAMMLALRPDLLAGMEAPPAADTPARPPVPMGMRPLIARPGESNGVTGGYSDDPARATAEAGERFLEVITREVARALVQFHAIPMRRA